MPESVPITPIGPATPVKKQDTFSDILCNYVTGVDIDDLRWKTELETNPALFFRQKSLYVISGMARFNRPPQMTAYLQYTPPEYDDYYYTQDAETAGEIVIETGKMGDELCSTGISGIDKFGNPYYTPIENTYDPETGAVTVTWPLDAWQIVQCDLYTDGTFDNPLSDRQKRILGLCVAYDWYSNFTNSWLNQQPKISDKSFAVKSENEWIRTTTERRRLLRQELDGELLSYEQSVAYMNTVPSGIHFKLI